MNTKMKKVNVTLEIPEDMEVGAIYGTASSTVLAVSLVPRKPKEILLREVIGVERIPAGHYYMREGDTTIYSNQHSSSLPLNPDETVYELVQNE